MKYYLPYRIFKHGRYMREKASILHIGGLCIICGLHPPINVYHLICQSCFDKWKKKRKKGV